MPVSEAALAPVLSACETTPTKFIVLGKPGAGKTTLLKYLALQLIGGRPEGFRVPLFIGLKAISDAGLSLEASFEKELSEAGLNTNEATRLVDRLLVTGQLLILLDGLDEVSEESQEAMIRQIESLSKT